MKKIIIITKDNKKIPKEMNLEECIFYFSDAINKWSHACCRDVKDVSHNVMDFDDFYSEGMISLIELFDKYKPINTFNTTLHKTLDNLRVDLLRKINAQKRRTDCQLLYFDKPIEGGSYIHDIEGDIDINFEFMEFNEDLNHAMSKLNGEEKEIVKFLINEESTKIAFAKKLGITRPTLDTRITIVKDKVINLLPEYLSA